MSGVVDEDVPRLEVTMDDAASMGVTNRITDLCKEGHPLLDRADGAYPLVKGRAANELHGEVDLARWRRRSRRGSRFRDA